MDNIFLLKLAITPRKTHRNLGISIMDWNYSDVFTSEKKAVTAGKKAMLKHLKYLKDITNRASNKNSIPGIPAWHTYDNLEEFIKEIEYSFMVYEFDPNVKRSPKWNRDTDWDEYVEWEYDYEGKIHTRYEWGDIGWNRLPSDYSDENAGTYFNPGDFVTITGSFGWGDDWCKDIVFVVFSAPGKRSEARHPEWWENDYPIYYIDKNNLVNHTHCHERQIRIYEGEAIPVDHPLQLLRKIALGGIKIKIKDGDDTSDLPPLVAIGKFLAGEFEDSEFEKWWNEACRGNITFDYQKKNSWRNVPELEDWNKSPESSTTMK